MLHAPLDPTPNWRVTAESNYPTGEQRHFTASCTVGEVLGVTINTAAATELLTRYTPNAIPGHVSISLEDDRNCRSFSAKPKITQDAENPPYQHDVRAMDRTDFVRQVATPTTRVIIPAMGAEAVDLTMASGMNKLTKQVATGVLFAGIARTHVAVAQATRTATKWHNISRSFSAGTSIAALMGITYAFRATPMPAMDPKTFLIGGAASYGSIITGCRGLLNTAPKGMLTEDTEYAVFDLLHRRAKHLAATALQDSQIELIQPLKSQGTVQSISLSPLIF